MTSGKVFPPRPRLTESELAQLQAKGIARLVATHGLERVALEAGCCTKTITNAMKGQALIRAHFAFNLYGFDPTGADDIMAAYGLRIVPRTADPANDFALIADTTGLVSEHMEAMRDGVRDHRETCRIADKARPVLAKYQPIIDEADRLRGRA